MTRTRMVMTLSAALLLACDPPPARAPHAAGAPIPPDGCPAFAVCLNVVPGGAGPLAPTRLVLMWTPPNERTPPEFWDLARLSGTERSLVIPLAGVPLPRSTIDMGQAWGYVFVLPAGDSGPPNPKNAVGVARMMFVHAVDAGHQAPLMRDKFPAGIAEGTAAYALTSGGRFDGFALAPPGSVFDLVICPPAQPDCDLPFPNPS